MDKGLSHIIGTPGCSRGFLLPLGGISIGLTLLSYLQLSLLGFPTYPACAHKAPSVLEGFWIVLEGHEKGWEGSLAVGMGCVPHSPGSTVA